MIDPRCYLEAAAGLPGDSEREFYRPFLFWFVVGVLSVVVFLLVHTF